VTIHAQPLAYAPYGTGTSAPDRLGILNIAGDLDGIGLNLLRRRCRAELDAQVTTLVLDFTGLTDFPSGLFHLLMETAEDLRARNSRLEMVGLNEAIALIVGGRD
jgi:anti-anti-sigma regulatory factor